MADAGKIIGAIKAFLELVSLLEELLDPDEKAVWDDQIIGFLKQILGKL